MDQLFDQVRDRTADLRRVAEAVRRERDLRAPTTTVAATGTPIIATRQASTTPPIVKGQVATECEAVCGSGPARQAA